MFVFYTRRFVLPGDKNTHFPDLAAILHDQREFTHWQHYNPAQWALVKIACVVGALVLLGVVVLNALFALPLPRFTEFEILREAFLLTGWLFLLLTVQLVGGLWLAGRYYNVGYLLAAALPGGVALAFMVLFSLWVQHLPAYLVATSPWMLLVFALWGYATGFYVNFVLAVAYRRINRFAYLLLALLVITLGATALLLTLRGVTLQTYSMAWTDEYRFVLWAGLWWGVGLTLGVLRVVEWFLCEYQEQPDVTEIPVRRGWTVPGSTQVPIDRLQAELDQWLHFDWQRGVNVVAAVARVAGQERPWVGALRGRLAADDGEDIVERLAAVYDCGVKRANVVLKPSKPKKTTGAASAGSGGGSGAPPKPKGQKRYQQEILLAKAIGHNPRAPLLDQESDQRSIEAAFWYYNQGYLFEAADILERLKSASSIQISATVEELRALAATFKIFLDLEAVSRLPAVALRDKPQVCRRTAAWQVLDQLADAARWVWRARLCKDPVQRNFCRGKFDDALRVMRNQIRGGHLAERTLVLGIIAMWQQQIGVVLQ